MFRRELSARLQGFAKRLRPPDPDVFERERLREERPLRVDEAERRPNLNSEFFDQRLTEGGPDRVTLLRHIVHQLRAFTTTHAKMEVCREAAALVYALYLSRVV